MGVVLSQSTDRYTHTRKFYNTELAYWGIQGLAQPARLLLNYQTTEKFTFKDYTSPDAWQADKKILDTPFPNIPYLKTEKEATHEKLLMFVGQISKQLKKHKFIAGDSVCWVDFKALHFLDVLSKFSSKIAEAEGISDYLKAVVDSGNDDFKAFYEAEKGRRPVFPPFTAWAGGKNMNDMQAEF